VASEPVQESLPDSVADSVSEPESHSAPEPPVLDEPDKDSVFDEPIPVRKGAGGYEDVLETVIRLVGDKTGYDREDLDPDYELEADLGIDTVKQAEIFSEMRDLYGVERDDDFVLADYPTLSALAGWLTQQISPSAPALPADVTDVPEPATAEMPLAELADESEPPESQEIDEPLVLPPGLPEGFALRQVGWADQPLKDLGGLPHRVYRVLGSVERAEALRSAILERGGLLTGEPDVVVDIGGSVFGSFGHAQRLLAKPPKEWVAVTGVVSNDPVSGTADGARAGLAKALGQEWRDCIARTIQIDRSLPAVRVAQLVCAELSASSGVLAPEIRLDENGVRQALELQVIETPTNGALTPGQVIVVTGGGRGICARIAREFAQRSPCRLVLVGRTPAADEPLDEVAEKARIKQALLDAGERATPRQVREGLAPLVKADEIRRTLVEIRSTGSQVEYRTCDLAVPDAVRGMISEILRSHGRIDVCVHGAGVEVSKPLGEKTVSGFHRVFDGKALGGLALAQSLPESCVLLSMGSVAGRFGNIGQVDYSAANEAMARVCQVRARSLHVDWTAWDDVGMAVRGGMKTLLTGRGVQLLPADAGAALTVDMIAAGLTGEVVVSGTLGGMLPSSPHPLVESVDFDGESWVLQHTLSVESDGWIVDHSIDGTPVLPGVIGVEMMAALAVVIRPGASFRGIEQVVFDTPVKLHRGEPLHLEVRARVDPDGGIRCTLSSQRTLKTGRVQRTDHFSGVVRTGQGPEFEPMPPAFFRNQPLGADAIYQRFFHGPVFQVLVGADDVTRDGLLARGTVDHASMGAVITHPLVLEAAFQSAGLHAMVADGILALPRSIESLTLPSPPIEGEDLQLTVRRRGDAYDVDVEQSGRVVMALRGFRMIEKGPLPEPERFPVPSGGFADRAFGSAVVIKAPSGVLNQAELEILQARGTPKRQAERIAGRVAAKRAIRALTGAEFADITLANLESGQPIATILGQPGPAVSISHSGELAVAVARRGGRIGLDLERIAERHPAFAQDWFTAGERALLGDDPALLTAGWTVKEAVLKALGTGMALSPREVEITLLTDERAEVALRGSVARKHLELGGGALEIRLQRMQGAYLAEAILAA
jgi:NAD(P)-dependent dehydrogenase (short-subunit alcohol dehydrogenase family)/4'-phosphopantetheinyl transferase EntD/acyl carrier protein